ncbi:DUF5977 domain-containing protein [Niabella sp. 22666]|uniref:DUF5977 domain-containing protein n=1 Tax=Niabella sp. 22666 TaxID=3453954 RepID=UPI003F83BF15
MARKFLLCIFLFFAGFMVFAQVNTIKYSYDAAGARAGRTPNASNTAAQWVLTGNTRCAKDTSNVNTGYVEKEERDNNTSSNTYNQLRWVASAYDNSACPFSTSSNGVKTGVFTKNDCSIGYAGTAVTYTVAAGTYTLPGSSLADQKAQDDVAANGQDYANVNGSCVLAAPVTFNLTNSFTTSPVPRCSIELIQNGVVVQTITFPISNSTISRSISSGSYKLRLIGPKGVFISFYNTSLGWAWDKTTSQASATTGIINFNTGTTYSLTATNAF